MSGDRDWAPLPEANAPDSTSPSPGAQAGGTEVDPPVSTQGRDEAQDPPLADPEDKKPLQQPSAVQRNSEQSAVEPEAGPTSVATSGAHQDSIPRGRSHMIPSHPHMAALLQSRMGSWQHLHNMA